MTAENAALPAALLSAPVARRAALWLLLLAPFFYLTYGIANWLAAQREAVPNLAFAWEFSLPFLAWTIVPYWSINLFYALSLFVNETIAGVDRLAGRYLTAQVVAVTCFIAFPLAATFTRPETSGIPGLMFDVLGGFDKPFNQAPSLHIALLVIIWDHLRRRMRGWARSVWHGWCALIGISVITTYQHHLIDIPTGALLGLFALWLFPPAAPSPLAGFRLTRDRKARRLAAGYGLGASLLVILTAAGVTSSGAALLLTWPALALAIVATGYLGAGPGVFQKSEDGRVTLASRLLLLPYRLGARVNAWAWTRKLPPCREIAAGVHLGRFPRRQERAAFAAIVDLSAEFIASGDQAAWKCFPSLDLIAPDRLALEAASRAIEQHRQQGPVLVCCALGFQRSAAAVALWLVQSGRAATADEALRLLTGKGCRIHLSAAVLETTGIHK